MALQQILSHIFCFLTKAQEIFDNLRLSNVVQLWTSLIRGYVENGQGGHAHVVSKAQGLDVVITK